MSRAGAIIQKLGGTRALAAALRLPVSTVQSWKSCGVIPARQQEAVLEAAARIKVPLEPAEFFDPGAVKRASGRAA
jgi:hypothetical protein